MWHPVLASVALILALVVDSPAAADCRDLSWNQPASNPSSARALTPDDLVRLRDVGPANNELTDHPLFTLSPDGSRIAFQVRRAHPEDNSYCFGMVVMKLEANANPVFVDRGGTLLQFSPRMSGQPGIDSGIPMVITPRWSRDGRWIAFLKQVDGATELWRAWSDGHGSQALTNSTHNVVDFRILDAAHLLVQVQDRSDINNHRETGEALTGFHYDTRFMPAASSQPIFVPPAPPHVLALDVATGKNRPASRDESRLFVPGSDKPASDSYRGASASLVQDGRGVPPIVKISMRLRNGHRATCPQTVCGSVEAPLWWNAGATAIRFFRRAGWGKSRTEIGEWRPGSRHARILYATEDYLVDCQPGRPDKLICLRETSTRPRHLVTIDLAQQTVQNLADFNPEFRNLRLGAVSRIRLKSSAGIETFADLVLPVNYQPGHRYPLIVVQYISRGFLRGGTGDEFPIQAYANDGYAVLSVQRPAAVGTLARPNTYVDVDRIGLDDFADRRNVLSVVEQGVRQLIARGIVDPGAVGITGLSDGSSTVQFAALNSALFSAGIVSGCCWERGQMALLGPSGDVLYSRVGWPDLIDPSPTFWSQISLAQNARRVAFPILFDMADDEFRLSLESYVALREAGRPADLFIFPNEHHIKWQPAHRLAAYQRSIEWFDFWLRNRLPTDPRQRQEAERWVALKTESTMRRDHNAPARAIH